MNRRNVYTVAQSKASETILWIPNPINYKGTWTTKQEMLKPQMLEKGEKSTQNLVNKY